MVERLVANEKVEGSSPFARSSMSNDYFEIGKKKFEKGLSFLLEQKYKEAEIEFIESLKYIPDRISTIKNLILIYIKTEDKKKISELLKKNKHLEKTAELIFAKAYYKFFEKKYDDAIKLCDSIIYKLKNNLEFEILGLLALCYKEKNLFLKSLKIYKKSLLKFKKNYITYSKIGNLFFELGKLKKAKIYFEKCYNLKPTDKVNLWNLSLCLLNQKKIKEGFRLYENRWALISIGKKKFQKISEIKKLRDIEGKKVLIWSEQGLGDNLLFSRFIPNLINSTKEISLQVDGNLEIFKFLYPEINVIHSKDVEIKNFDYQTPICSLPYILGINKLEELNLKKLNLKQNIKNENKFKLQKNKLNIGLALHGNDKYRRIPLKYFNNLLENTNIQFYNLSKGANFSELLESNSKKIIDLGNKNFLQLSETLIDLDMIFSIDTSLIHLCGNLNIDSYLLLNFNSFWTWFDDSKKTVWYPSVTIIKQNNFSIWDNVIDEVKKIVNNKLKINGQISR